MAQKWKDIRHRGKSPERIRAVRERVDAELAAMSLREVREAAGMTQTEAAEAAEMTQSELSKIERRDDLKISTVRRYVEALGGQLEVTAVVGNKRITLAL